MSSIKTSAVEEEAKTGAMTDDDLIDEASAESFPASDAPGYRSSSIGGRAADFGQPDRTPEKKPGRPES